MNSRKNLLLVSIVSTTLLIGGTGCASLFSHGKKTAEKSTELAPSSLDPSNPLVLKDEKIHNLESTVTTLNSRIQELEGKLQASQNRPILSQQAHRQSSDAPIRATVAESDPESGFANDQNTRAFQQGKILFDQEKYPEAILAFSAFLEHNANHTLVSQVQYYIAESYYLEGDYTVADQEFQKQLVKYPRSPRASFALVRLSLCAEKLGKADQAKRYRLQAEALYPKSPALKGLRETTAPKNTMQSLVVVPPTAPEVDTPRVDMPSVESPKVEAPHVEAPRIDSPQVQAPKIETQTIDSTTRGSDLDSPPSMGGGG